MMKAFIKRNATGKKALIFFFLATTVYVLMLGITIPEVMSYGQGMKLLDMMPMGYSPEYVRTLFNALGEKGRNAYLYHQLPLDMIYPFLFGVSYSLIMAYFFMRLGKTWSIFFYLCFLPPLAALFDYLENIGIFSMLIGYPKEITALTMMTSVFSMLKSMLTTAYFIALIVVVLIFAFKKGQVKSN
jgi:hypothetical protein